MSVFEKKPLVSNLGMPIQNKQGVLVSIQTGKD
jgi:hypothetical protein